MRVLSLIRSTTARAKLSSVLEESKTEEIIIKRRKGELYAVSPKTAVLRSPFDIPSSGLKTNVTADDIVGMVQESRERPYRCSLVLKRHSDKEFVRFLMIAKGSISELRTQLEIAKDINYITPDTFDQLEEKCNKIGSMLTKLIIARRGESESRKSCE